MVTQVDKFLLFDYKYFEIGGEKYGRSKRHVCKRHVF